MLEGLRNNLAHAQDIVSCDWDAIVRLSDHLDRVLKGEGSSLRCRMVRTGRHRVAARGGRVRPWGIAMTWEQRYRLRHAARTSLVLWAGLSLAAALLVAPAVRWLDQETGWVVFGFSPDGARAVLGALVGSMLTFIVFVLSATLIVVQLASGQLTPRVIALVFALPGVKVTLGALHVHLRLHPAALGRVEDRVPDLHVGVAVLLNLACIVVFFLFVQRLSTGLRPTSMMQLVADRGPDGDRAGVPAGVRPGTGPSRPPERGASRRPRRWWSSSPGGPGWSWRSAWRTWCGSPGEADAVVELVPQVGDFVAAGDPLFRVYGGTRPLSPARAAGVRRGRGRADPGAGPAVRLPHPGGHRQQGPVARRSTTRPPRSWPWTRSTTCCSASAAGTWTRARPATGTGSSGSSTAPRTGPTT